jgi:hypothetical protein
MGRGREREANHKVEVSTSNHLVMTKTMVLSPFGVVMLLLTLLTSSLALYEEDAGRLDW